MGGVYFAEVKGSWWEIGYRVFFVRFLMDVHRCSYVPLPSLILPEVDDYIVQWNGDRGSKIEKIESP